MGHTKSFWGAAVIVLLMLTGCNTRPDESYVLESARTALSKSEDAHKYSIEKVNVVNSSMDDGVFETIIEYEVTIGRSGTFISGSGDRYLLPLGRVEAGRHKGRFRLRFKKYDNGWDVESAKGF